MNGALLGVLAFAITLATGVVWFRRLRAVAVPENRAAFVAAMAVGAGLGVLALIQGAGLGGGIAAGASILLGGMYLLTVVIGDQKGGTGAFRIGEPVPSFTAPDDQGEAFALESQAGKPLLLKFFRGHW